MQRGGEIISDYETGDVNIHVEAEGEQSFSFDGTINIGEDWRWNRGDHETLFREYIERIKATMKKKG